TFLQYAQGRLTYPVPPHVVSVPPCNNILPTALPPSAAAQATRPHLLPATSYTACRSAAQARCTMARMDVDVCTLGRLSVWKNMGARLEEAGQLAITEFAGAPDTEGAKAERGPSHLVLWTRPPLGFVLHHDLFPLGGHWGLELTAAGPSFVVDPARLLPYVLALRLSTVPPYAQTGRSVNKLHLGGNCNTKVLPGSNRLQNYQGWVDRPYRSPPLQAVFRCYVAS
ncbi:hypothetical protein EDB83DRAFT_2377895, partial [Lactarius deliciosus]